MLVVLRCNGVKFFRNNHLKNIRSNVNSFISILFYAMIVQMVWPLAAFSNPKNGGLGFSGLLLNSGWYWTPT